MGRREVKIMDTVDKIDKLIKHIIRHEYNKKIDKKIIADENVNLR